MEKQTISKNKTKHPPKRRVREGKANRRLGREETLAVTTLAPEEAGHRGEGLLDTKMK